MTVPELDVIIERVGQHEPTLQKPSRRGFRAATALVLTQEQSPRMLVIARAHRSGDPWSGHAALPGGKHDPTDPDLATTARRETWEEVGVTIGEPVGRLDDIGGRQHFGVVTPFVFVTDEAHPFTLEAAEVAAAHWVPVSLLTDPDARTRHPHRRVGPWPGYRYEDLTIWGLTYLTLQTFAKIAGIPAGGS